MKTTYKEEYEIDDSFDRIDFDIVQRWLSGAYWSPGIEKGEVVKGAANSSMVVGCYFKGAQAGYLRAVSDKTRFGYLLDVFVDEKHRGKGIARGMIRFVLEHPDLKGVYQWLLATKDAHGVYSKLGFAPLADPEKWMMIKKERERKI